LVSLLGYGVSALTLGSVEAMRRQATLFTGFADEDERTLWEYITSP
jgi:hypothetical protein